jgi:hypothetical protein
MPDIIITPSTGKLEFVDNSSQIQRRHSFTLDDDDGIKVDAAFRASSVRAPLNVINVTVNNSNVNYPFVLASGSAETGIKTLMMDGSGGTYNPFTNTATIDISGNSATTTLASNSTNLGGVAAASYVTLTGTQTLTNKTITGTFTGNLTGTGSWATNAVNANTATNSTQLNGQSDSYYTNIPARLGYTPVNKAGDTVTGNLIINGNFTVNGATTLFSASNVYISSSQLYIEDNILTLNAFSPYLRYAGVEMYDSGSGTLSSLLWDGEADYFFLSGSSVNGKIITGPDGQTNLSSNYIPKATAGYKLGNSLIYDNGTNVGIGTTTPSGKLSTGATSGMKLLVYDNAATGVYTGLGQDLAAGNSTDLFAHSVSNLGFITFGKIGTNGTTYTEWARFNTSGSLGIGTNNPFYKLDVTGSLGVNASSADNNWPFVVSDNSSAGSRYSLNKYGSMGFNNADNYAQLQLLGSAGAYVDFTNSIGGDSNARLIYYAGSRLDLTYGFATTITLNGTGVGIGTTSPGAKLDVNGNAIVTGSLITTSTIVARNYIMATDTLYIQKGVGGYQSYITAEQTAAGTGNSFKFWNSGTATLMTIGYDGSVGIGTTLSAQKLDVVGNIRCVPASSAWAEGLSFSMPATSSWGGLRWRRERANADGNHYIGYIGTDTTDDLVFGSNNAGTQIDNNIRITKAGLVGVGTSSPVTKFHVVGVISGSSFSGAGTGLTGTAASLTAGTATNATQLGGVSAASYVTLNDTQSLTNKTITGTFTGALTGNASTATALTSMNISQFTNNSLYQYHRGDITSLSSSATNVVQPLGTFDGSNITNAPTSGWYNYLSSTHGSYLTSLIANLHRTSDWYVGYKEGPGGTPTNPSWFKLLHSGNYSSYTNLTASWATNAVTALNVGNGTITIAAGTGVGVGTTNTFTTNQSGATTVTISNSGVTSNVAGTGISLSGGTGAVTITNSGVTSNVAGTGISVSGATGAVTITNSSPNATHTGDVTGATALTIANDAVTTVKILNANVTNAKLANSSLTIGSTAISLGATATTIAGLTSVTSTTFVGALTGNATTATALTSMNISQFTNNSGYLTSAVTSLAGTTNRITVSGATGAVTLNLPQDIHTGASPTFAGLSLTSVSTTGATITNLTGAYQNTTVYDSAKTQSATPSRGIRAPASSIQFTDSYAIAPFWTYRSTGDWPVPYGIGWGTGGESSGIFQRYASNGSSFGDMIFYTGNDGSGAFSFRRHTWEGTAHFAAGSGELNTELFRIDWSGNVSMLGTLNGSANSATLYANNGSYGAWAINGTRGGWGGIEFANNGVSLMMGSDTIGFHQNTNGWLFRVHQGVGYIYKGSWGGGTAAVILDSSNAPYANNMNQNVRTTDSPTFAAVSATTFTGTLNGNANAVSFTEVELNAPVTVSGTWTTGNGSEWGEPKFGTSFNQFRYTDDNGPYVEYNIPANHHACFISQLQWSSGGYADCHGVQSDGDLVFLRRINTRQLVENSNHGNPIQHDGATVTFVGSGLQAFSKIRITNRSGRIHMTGIAFTRQVDDGYEGTGMLHPAQISHQGAGSGLDADLLDGYNSATANTANTIVLRDGSGNFSAGTITAALSGNATTATSINGFGNPTTNSTANTIVYREGNGYITNNYFHTSGGGSERNASGMAYFAGFNSSDYYIRSYTAAAVATLISGQTMNINGSSTSCTGNAATATSADNIDSRPFVNTNSNSATNADTINSNGISYYTSGVTNFSGNATDGALFSQAYSNDWQHQIAGDYRSGQIALRGKNNGTWQSWRRVLDETNSPYALNMNQYVRTTDSPTFSTVTAALSGNATTATTLQTARNINGTSFNGSAAITTATWGTARTLTIGSTGKSVDGSAAITWSLAEIGAAATNQTMFIGTTSVAINRASTSQTLTGVSIDGNAATVTNGAYLNAAQTFTNINVISNSNNTVINTLSGNLGLTMFQATAGTDAYMTFHIGGDYAAYFGLGGVENDLVYGGWSAGNNRHRILHSGNAAYAWNMNQYVRTTDSPTFSTVTATLNGNAGSVTYLPNRTDSTAYPVLWGAAYTNAVGTIAYSCAAVTIQSSTGTLTATSFSGAGTGLTGTAASLSIGGSAASLVSVNTYTVGALNVNGMTQLTGVKETYVAVSPSSNVVTIDLNAGTVFRMTYNSVISSFTISNLTSAKVNSFTLISIASAGAGGITFTFTGYTLKWAGGTAPTATTTAGKFDVFSFIYDGTNWYGFTGGLNY